LTEKKKKKNLGRWCGKNVKPQGVLTCGSLFVATLMRFLQSRKGGIFPGTFNNWNF
jgi:hypothetical protein